MTKVCACHFVLLRRSFRPGAERRTPYTIDNFDFANGVRIETPSVRKPAKSTRRLTRLTALRVPSQAPLIDNNTLTNFNDSNANNALSGFTTGNAAVDAFIVASGKRNAVDPLLLYSIMHQESTFKRNALSPKGASGLMQLMPPTRPSFGVSKDLGSTAKHRRWGAYMRFLLDHFGTVQLALAGYNAGEVR